MRRNRPVGQGKRLATAPSPAVMQRTAPFHSAGEEKAVRSGGYLPPFFAGGEDFFSSAGFSSSSSGLSMLAYL